MRASRVVLLCAVAVLALALAAAVQVDAQGKGKAKVKATAAGAGGKDAKQRLPHIRTKRESPLKGVSPAPKPKGKQPTDKVLPRTANTAGNAAMGAAVKADAPKTTAKPTAGAQKEQQKPQQQKQKATGAGRLHKFRQQHVLQADADAGAAAQVTTTAAGGVVYPARNPTNDGWLLTASTVIPDAMVDKIAAEMAPLPAETTFYHWDSPQPCIRWARNGMSEGEIKWFDNNSAGMASGGGLYMSSSLNSCNYGPFPCRVVIKKGTLQYDDNAVAKAYAKAKLPAPGISQDAKVALGQIIPFIHMYSSSSGWWVTHHWQVFARFIGGTHDSPFEAGKLVVPHWDSPEWQHGNTHMGLWKLWNQMYSGAGNTKSGKIEPESALNDLRGSMDWLRKFTYLFSYIDGPSLIRALSVSPNDPFNVFEKEKFPGFMALYERLVQTRLAEPSTTKSLFGVSRGGRFGSETAANADAWAQEVFTKTYPKLWSEIAGGKQFALRTGEVRAGGDEEGRTFIATTGQVQVMKKNPYLTVVDSPPRPDGTVLCYYYYPDPLHLPQTLKSRVSAAVWEQCLDVQRMATAPGADFEAVKKSAEYGAATQALMKDLLLDLFKRIYGGDPRFTSWGLTAMMDLVSIHPNDDYNGRTTRMFGVVAAIESSYDPPIAFMSDFDLVTSTQQYSAFLQSASTAYLNLKIAMTSELMTAVCNSAQPNLYGVSAWATFAYDALKPFLPSSVTTVKFGDGDWDTIAHRRFIVLMDKVANAQWIGRAASGTVAPPAVQKPGDALVLTPPPPKAPAPTK